MSKVAILGCGNIGKRLADELKPIVGGVYDPYVEGYTEPLDGTFDAAFICVDTPLTEDGLLDTSAVLEAFEECDTELFVVKSTVPVGFTEIQDVPCIFSPEYYGTTQHANNFKFAFTVLGGEPDLCRKAQNILQDVYDARHRFIRVTSREAEAAKLMENAWIATKVDFCIGFYEACEAIGADYQNVRECFVADPRVSAAHTFVYEAHPYWQSHCLDKDVPYAANIFDSEQLKQIVERNTKRKNIHRC